MFKVRNKKNHTNLGKTLCQQKEHMKVPNGTGSGVFKREGHFSALTEYLDIIPLLTCDSNFVHTTVSVKGSVYVCVCVILLVFGRILSWSFFTLNNNRPQHRDVLADLGNQKGYIFVMDNIIIIVCKNVKWVRISRFYKGVMARREKVDVQKSTCYY